MDDKDFNILVAIIIVLCGIAGVGTLAWWIDFYSNGCIKKWGTLAFGLALLAPAAIVVLKALF